LTKTTLIYGKNLFTLVEFLYKLQQEGLNLMPH
jgi:hypothetical protein